MDILNQSELIEITINKSGKLIEPNIRLFAYIGTKEIDSFEQLIHSSKANQFHAYLRNHVTEHLKLPLHEDIESDFTSVLINGTRLHEDTLKLNVMFVKEKNNLHIDSATLLDNINMGIILYHIDQVNHNVITEYINDIALHILESKNEIKIEEEYVSVQLDQFIIKNYGNTKKNELCNVRCTSGNNTNYYICELKLLNPSHMIVNFFDITDEYKEKLNLYRNMRAEKLLNNLFNVAEQVDDEKDFLFNVLTELGETLQVDRTYLYVYDENEVYFNLVAFWNNPNRLDIYHLDQRFTADNFRTYRTKLLNGKVLYTSDISKETDGYHTNLRNLGITANINVPVFLENRFYGFFGYDLLGKTILHVDEDISLLRSVGALISKSLQKLSIQKRLVQSEFLFRSQFEHGHIGITIEDFYTHEIYQVNDKFLEILELNYEELSTYDWKAHTFEDDLYIELQKYNMLISGKLNDYRIEKKVVLKNGKIKHIDVHVTSYYDPISDLKYIVTAMDDITSKMQYIKKIEYMSYHDELTGLSNRGAFEEHVRLLETEKKVPVSIMVGDVNNLKLTNDILGHQKGDKLLQYIAYILKDTIGTKGVVYRWAGDEFSALIPDCDEEQADQIRRDILARIKKNDLYDQDIFFKPSISLGFATKVSETEYLKDIFSQAEVIMYRRKLTISKKESPFTLLSLERTLIEKSKETKNHTKRMAKMAKAIGLKLGLSKKEIKQLEVASKVHDIGKIAINNRILEKPKALTPDEWLEIKRHPEIGYRIAIHSQELFSYADFVLSHHEKIDGTGYPNGLNGEQIPKISKILSILDAYDAMTHDRVYKKAVTKEEAIQELISNSGTQFDAEIVQSFISILESEQ